MTRKKVTDPNLLAELNRDPRKQVTDPALLAQLNNQQQEQAPEHNENLMQKVMRYGLKDPAIGLLKGGREFANLPNKMSGGRIPEFSPSDYDFGAALGVDKPDAGDNAMQFLGQYGPSFAIPGANLGKAGAAITSIPKVGKYASAALSEAIPQGLFSAAQAPQDGVTSGAETAATVAPFGALNKLMQGTNRIGRMAAQAGLGLGGAYVGREGAKQLGFGETASDVAATALGALGSRGMGTKKEMMRKMTEGVDADIANPRLRAAQRLKLDYLTPAEASVNPWSAKKQGALGRTEEGGKMLYERGIERQGSERNAINRTLDMIYDEPTMKPQIDEAYEKVKPVNLPPEFSLQYKDNAIINAAEKRVKSRPAYKESLKKMLPENVKLEEGQADVSPTSLVYWDHVKRALYDMEQEAGRKGSGGESSILNSTRRDMVGQMDSHFPEYADARGLYERKKVRDGLEKVFDQKEINGTNFYRALASENKFDELLGHLKNAPEAAQNLKDMRLLFKDLMGPPTIKTAKGTEERGMNQMRNKGAYLESLIEHAFTKGGNDKAAIEFITSPNWAKQMQEISKISDKQLKAAAISMAIGRGVGQYAGTSK